jgi:hypothetical protein
MHQDDPARAAPPKGSPGSVLPLKAFRSTIPWLSPFRPNLIAFFWPRRGIAALAETDAAVAVFSALVMRHFGAFF